VRTIHPQGSNRCGDLQSILGITINDDEPRSASKWKCFSQLLHDPRAGRMLCDIEVQDTPTVVTDDEKTIERGGGDRKLAYGHKPHFFTVLQPPSRNNRYK
jgi:hypothetical protein